MTDLPDGYYCIGNYQPSEAKKFMDALDAEGVDFIAEFDDGAASSGSFYGGSFGQEARVTIAASRDHRAMIDRVHSRIFGASTPQEGSFDSDGEMVALLEERGTLVSRLDDVTREMHALRDEIAAVERELAQPGGQTDRVSALTGGLDRHVETAKSLLVEEESLNAKLADLDTKLYPDAD